MAHWRILWLVAAAASMAFSALAQTADEGVAQMHSGRLAEAERTLRASSERESKDVRSRYYLILTLAHERKLDEAEAVRKSLDEAAPGSYRAALAAARLSIERKDYERAESAIKEAQGAAEQPAQSGEATLDLLYVRGLLHAAKKEYAAAAEDLEKVIEKQPRNAYAHYYAGLAYNALKRPDKMIEHFQHFLRLAPEAPEARKVQSVLRAVG